MPKLQRVLKTWLSLNKEKARAWISGNDGNLYVRRTEHWIEHKHRTCIDIGSIEIYDKGKGKLTKLLMNLVETTDTEAVYVESVLNKRLIQFLLKQGFKQVNDYEPSYYKLVEARVKPNTEDIW